MLATAAAISGAPSLTFGAAPMQHFQSPGSLEWHWAIWRSLRFWTAPCPLPLPDMYRGILPKDAAHSLIPHIVEKLTVYMSNQGYPT